MRDHDKTTIPVKLNLKQLGFLIDAARKASPDPYIQKTYYDPLHDLLQEHRIALREKISDQRIKELERLASKI